MPRAKRAAKNVDDPKLYRIKQFHGKFIVGNYWVNSETKIKPNQYIQLTDDDALAHLEAADPKLEPVHDVDESIEVVELGNKVPSADLVDMGHAASTTKLKENDDLKEAVSAKDAEIEALKAQLAGSDNGPSDPE